MTTGFDPYHIWLGISPQERKAGRPPNHYRLLGLPLFEESLDAIEAAAERQIAYVRQSQIGQHKDDAQRILGELAQARACLRDAARKAVYDARLRQALRAAQTAAGAGAGNGNTPQRDPLERPQQQAAASRHSTSTSKLSNESERSMERVWMILGAAAVAVIGVVLAAVFLFPPSPYLESIDSRTAQIGEEIVIKPKVAHVDRIDKGVRWRLVRGEEHHPLMGSDTGEFRWTAPSVSERTAFDFEIAAEARSPELSFRDAKAFQVIVYPDEVQRAARANPYGAAIANSAPAARQVHPLPSDSVAASAPAATGGKLEIVAVATPYARPIENGRNLSHEVTSRQTLRLNFLARGGASSQDGLSWSVTPNDSGAAVSPIDKAVVNASFAFAEAAMLQWIAPDVTERKNVEFTVTASDSQGAVASETVQVAVIPPKVSPGSAVTPRFAPSAAGASAPRASAPRPAPLDYAIELPNERVLHSNVVTADAQEPRRAARRSGLVFAELRNEDGGLFARAVYEPPYKIVDWLELFHPIGAKRMLAEYVSGRLDGRLWLYDKEGKRVVYAQYVKGNLHNLRCLLADEQPVLIQEWKNGNLERTHWVEDRKVKESWDEPPEAILQQGNEAVREALAPLFAQLDELDQQIKDDEVKTRRLIVEFNRTRPRR